MKPYYREATVQDALIVANNIRDEDRQEIEGLGLTPFFLPISVMESDAPVAFFDELNNPLGVAGVVTTNPGEGQVWMICTPYVQRIPHTLVRQAKKWLAKTEQDYNILYNIADTRNVLHHKLLKILGFKALRRVYPEPYLLPYYEIVKLCAYQH